MCLHFTLEFCDHVVKPPHSCDIRGKQDFPEEQSSNSISDFGKFVIVTRSGNIDMTSYDASNCVKPRMFFVAEGNLCSHFETFLLFALEFSL